MCLNKKIFFVFGLVLAFFLTNVRAQNTLKYHRVKIELIDQNPFKLFKLDIAMDHGNYVPGKYFESDFSEEEISAIQKLGFKTEIVIHDVEAYYGNQDRPSIFDHADYNGRNNLCKIIPKNHHTPSNYFEGSMGGYFTYDEMLVILDWMQNLYPNLITKLDTIEGIKTYNNNVIHYLKVSDNPEVDENTEPQVLYTALHHAREPNSLSQMIFYLWYLLENYNKNDEIKYLIDNTEMYFIPCVNPDGYKINETNRPLGGGMWRKNGWKDTDGKLKGVDLNRNYGYQWAYDNEGSSNNENSDTYRGNNAFSEPETQAIRKLCKEKNFSLALNYHSFGNYLIHPWGYNNLPTTEDSIFKRMGNVLIGENDFIMGTGTETVGYTTNGDSDDYMYGEQVEKNKIYSFTPEVGYSFWPVQQDIDQLNKSCVQMNLSLPKLANGVIEHEIMNSSRLLTSTDNDIQIRFSNPGLKNRSSNVEIKLINPSSNNLKSLTVALEPGQNLNEQFKLQVDTALLTHGINDITVVIIKDYNTYRSFDTVVFNYFNGKENIIFYDDCSGLENWTSNGNWGLSFIENVTPPSAFTDSPMTFYGKNQRNKIELFKGLDLSQGKSPILKFYAKWNIENNFDYATVYAFVPGKDTVRLCGNYTNLGTENQLKNEPIYDGSQKNWVEEFISLQDLEGEENVFINVELVSDGNLEMDGIYIDEIKVLMFTAATSVTQDTESSKKSLFYPNPGNGSISFRNKVDFIEVIDMNGRLILNTEVENNFIDVNLNSGIYELRSFYNDQLIDNSKLTIVK